VKKASVPSASTSGYSPGLESTMFFMRLRRGAKWAFIVVIFAFAFSFLFAGVGGGSGSSDVIQQLLGMRGGDPIKGAENDVAKHPHSAHYLAALALAYEGKGRRGDAITTYTKYSRLKPKDTGALSALSRLEQEVATLRWDRYASLKSGMTIVYGPLSSDPLDSLAGTDTLISAYSSLQISKINSAYTSYTMATKAWESTCKLWIKAVPTSDLYQRANVELQLGESAYSGGDYTVALNAYTTFLKLVPKDSRASQVKKAVAQLRKLGAKG
jgi:tetratricopeptide (TPR) repeat protein